MNSLMDNYPQNKEDMQILLNQFTPKIQRQLVSALYHGRDHLHEQKLRESVITCGNVEHLTDGQFAEILSGKSVDAVSKYFSAIKSCALASNFDLNLL